MHTLPVKAKMAYIAQANIHLPLLLSLDSIDRKINAYIRDAHQSAILSHHYLKNRYSKISVFNTLESALEDSVEILIIVCKFFELLRNSVKMFVSFG